MFNVDRLENLVKNGLNKNLLTKFLSIEEQKYLQSIKYLKIYFSNTYPEEERKRAYLASEDIDEPIDFKIAILEFFYPEGFVQISHRDVLGALVSLGIKREVVGDIIISSRNFILFIEEMADFIINNLSMIKNSKVQFQKATIDDLLTVEINNYFEDQIIVSSLRLDNIVSEVSNISRAKACEMINNQLVKVNGIIKTNPSGRIAYDDIISIRGIGRIIIKGELKKTKKDKTVLRILKTK